MTYAKTPAGQAALGRHAAMTPRQRAAFILFDGRRSCVEVRASTRIGDDEITQLVALGYVVPVPLHQKP